jgi:hypothetical protein
MPTYAMDAGLRWHDEQESEEWLTITISTSW